MPRHVENRAIAHRVSKVAFVGVAAWCASACSALAPLFETDLGEPDANVAACVGTRAYPADLDACELLAPSGALDLGDGSWLYDTATGTLTSPTGFKTTPASELHPQPTGDDIRVLSVTAFRVRKEGAFRATGVYPLLIAAGDIQIDGLLSVASSRFRRGPGADSALCGILRGRAGKQEGDTSGGGGGGSIRAQGGDGGDAGDAGSVSGGGGGEGDDVFSSLRGGCQGGKGGGVQGGLPGAGGGALVLLATGSVELRGQINAGGQGGYMTTANFSGGGGGGSGGVVGINAPIVIVHRDAVLAANGGGGAQASSMIAGAAGQDGQLSTEAALGGLDAAIIDVGAGGEGGARARESGLPGADGQNAAGGGGGGGSAGAIIVNAELLDVDSRAVVSPGLIAF